MAKFVGKYRNGPLYEFNLRWEGSHQAWIGFLVEEAPDGERSLLSFRKSKIVGAHGTAKPQHHLLHYVPDYEMRDLLQTIVDEAARHGIVASNAGAEATATRRHLEDMQKLTFQLLDTVTTNAKSPVIVTGSEPVRGSGLGD